MRGKPWSKDEELKLKHLYDANNSYYIIAAQLGKTPEAIRQKLIRLGLKEVEHHSLACSTTQEHAQPEPLPPELPSIEEALKILATALKQAHNPDLNPTQTKRLYTVAKLAKTYKELLADYIDYRHIETKLIEMEEKYARLVQATQSTAPRSNTDAETQTATPRNNNEPS